MNLLQKLFGKKETWVPFEEGTEFLSQVGIDVSALHLPETSNPEYAKAFSQLRAEPYMDYKTLKVKVTGTYAALPMNEAMVEGRWVPGIPTRVKIDTFGRIPKKE
jgi:hypothetical protein